MNVSGGGWSHRAPGEYGWCSLQSSARWPVRMRAMRSNRPDDAPTNNAPIGKESLKQRMQALQSEMAAINKQLDELKKEEEEEEETEN